jgi:hypothetical protein
MTGFRFWLALTVAALFAPRSPGASPPKKGPDAAGILSLLGGGSVDALAGSLRGYFIQALPTPLYEDRRHWGQQKAVTRGARWRGQEKQPTLKNNGRWWKVQVTANNLRDSLVLDLRDVERPEPGRMLFTAFLSFDAQVEYERQTWRNGVRLYSGSVRARLRAKLTLRCEATARLEGTGILLPDAVFRLRALQSDFRYDNLVVEHIAGVGGEAAKLLGEAVRGGMQQLRPSLEHDLLAKANAAVVKAADTREVRLSLFKLFEKK